MTSAFFIQILNMSLGAAWAAVLVMAFRPLLRRLSHAYSYALWGVVLFRLVCPFSFSSVFSLMPRPQTIPQEIVYTAQPEIESGFTVIDQAVNQTLSSVPAVAPPPVASAPAVPASVSPMRFWLGAGKLVWQAGMALLLLYGLVSLLRFLGTIRGAVLVQDNIWESDRVPTACVLGLVRPKIYLPTGLKETERKYVLCHEQTHIRRLDHIVKPVSLLLLTIHWFNPVLWLGYILMRRDMEMSCDERALKELGEQNRKGYSACLVNLSARSSGLAAPLAFGENDVKGRVLNILRYKKPALWASALAVVLAGALGFCLLANPGEDRQPAPADPGEGSGIVLSSDPIPDPEENRQVMEYFMPIQAFCFEGSTWASPNEIVDWPELFQSIYSCENKEPPAIRYGDSWPVEVMVETLSRYFEGITADTVTANADYRPGTGSIHYQREDPPGNGMLNITGWSWDVDREHLAIDYKCFPDSGESFTHRLTIKILPDDSFRYLSNEKIVLGTDSDPVPVIHYTAPVRGSSQQTVHDNHLDYAVDPGTPVYSPIRGIVEELADNSNQPLGKTVVVRSSENPEIILTIAHLQTIAESLKAGDPVDSSTQLGAAGATGNTTGPIVAVVVQQMIAGGQASAVPAEQWDDTFVGWRDGISGDPLNERTLPGPTNAPVPVHYTAPVRVSSQQTVRDPNQMEYRVDFGTPIYSPIRGTVEEFTNYSIWPYGKSIVVRSSENPDILLMMAHMGAIAEEIKVGDQVDSATQLGIAGATGNASYNTATVAVRRKADNGGSSPVYAEEWDAIFDNWRDGISGDPDPDPYTILGPLVSAHMGNETWGSPREIGKLPHIFEALYTSENREAPSEAYGDNWPVSVMAETLSHYFEDITAQDIISSGDYDYDPVAGTICHNWEREEQPPLLTGAVSWARASGVQELFTIDYRQVSSYVGDPEDKAYYRRLIVRLLPDGSFRYLSNLESQTPAQSSKEETP